MTLTLVSWHTRSSSVYSQEVKVTVYIPVSAVDHLSARCFLRGSKERKTENQIRSREDGP